MEKIIKKDYPFTVIIEDKKSKNTGKPYIAISVLHTKVKNKDAIDPKEKYETTYFNFFDGGDLLKLSSLCENSYIELTGEKNKERQAKKQETPKETTYTATTSVEFEDSDFPF